MSSQLPSFLKFTPIIKDKVWGGSRLGEQLGKQAGSSAGESWEISGVKGSVSEVSNGKLKGRSLQSLLNEFKDELVGKHVYSTYGRDFPLLFKYIDASDDLSVQLHPNDKLARQRHDSFGKTEMWYIVDSDPGSRLILGFNRPVDMQTYQDALEHGKLTEILHEQPVSPGDSFFISTGTVHAIGAGILLAEIQQTSDITYRIYDWDRPDANGNYRELHTAEALEAIDYESKGVELKYDKITNKAANLCSSDYFVTNRIQLSGSISRSPESYDSFLVYMCVDGSLTLSDGESDLALSKGETVLVPACSSEFKLESEHAVLLEVYIP